MKNKHLYTTFIIGALLVFFNQAFAQILKQKDFYTVYINYPDHTVKTTVSNSTKRITVKESVTYYWYASNKIIQTRGDYDGKMLDGAYTAFYLSNNLKEKGVFKKGVKDGKWISWYEDGKINEITNWKNGEKWGEYRKFTTDEALSLVSNYKKDKLNGKLVIYKDGKADSIKIFKKGKEIVKPQANSVNEKQQSKNKIAAIFNKKTHEVNDKEQSTPAEKKTLKEKKKPLFQKKDKRTPSSGKPSSPEDPNLKGTERSQEATK